jgi:hypothetical protein
METPILQAFPASKGGLIMHSFHTRGGGYVKSEWTIPGFPHSPLFSIPDTRVENKGYLKNKPVFQRVYFLICDMFKT